MLLYSFSYDLHVHRRYIGNLVCDLLFSNICWWAVDYVLALIFVLVTLVSCIIYCMCPTASIWHTLVFIFLPKVIYWVYVLVCNYMPFYRVLGSFIECQYYENFVYGGCRIIKNFIRISHATLVTVFELDFQGVRHLLSFVRLQPAILAMPLLIFCNC